jgi:hypothetical protein
MPEGSIVILVSAILWRAEGIVAEPILVCVDAEKILERGQSAFLVRFELRYVYDYIGPER